MLHVERFTEQRQRAELLRLAEGASYLETVPGAALLEQLRAQVVPGVISQARRLGLGEAWVCTSDVVHTAIIGLCSHDGRVARYAAKAEGEPWAYVFRCLSGWMSAQWGIRAVSLEEGAPAESSASSVSDAPDEALTPLSDVVRLAVSTLESHTPCRLRGELAALLEWLALNPPQRSSYEQQDRAAALGAFPAFTRCQIAAVAKAAWGARPNRGESSLFAAYLQDADFRATSSVTHVRTLLRYKQAMYADELLAAAA